MSQQIEQAIEAASDWLGIEGVEFVGEGTHEGSVCIVVGVSRPAEELRDQLPSSFHGFAVILEFTGTIRAG